MSRTCLRLGALLVVLGAGAALAQGLVVNVDPAFAQLGETARVRVTVKGPPGLKALHLSTNHGRVGEAREAAPGVYEAEYLPPSATFPRTAVVAAWAEREGGVLHGFTPLPLWGQGVAVVTTVPRANVTLRIGTRDFGPVQADAKGRGEVRVQVPPGATHAMHGKRAIDLGLPVVTRLHVLALPDVVPADAPRRVTLRVYSVAVDGALESAKVRLTVPLGVVGPLRWVQPGVAEATWDLPAQEPGTLEVNAWAVGAKGDPAAGRLRVTAGPAVTAALVAERTTYVAGDGRRITLRLRARDAKGRAADDAATFSADFGSVTAPVPAGPGEARAELQVPDRFDGHGTVTVAATVGAARATATVQLVAGPAHEVRLPNAEPLRAREQVTLRGEVVDAWENPVLTPPTVTAERGVVVVERDGAGFLLRYTAPSTRSEEPAALQLAAASVTQTHTITVVPRPALLTGSLKGGYATNLGAVSAPMGGLEVGVWAEPWGRHLGVVLEGGLIGSTSAATVARTQETVSAHTTFVPVVLSVALDLPLTRLLWLRPAVGGGVSALFQTLRVSEEPWVSESGLGAAAQLSLQAGLRVGVGGPFVEVRGLFVSNPGLATLEGALFSMTFSGGYVFDIL